MLDEARKREKVANAFLLATLSASAAQSPRDFVRTGFDAAPGVAEIQRTIGNPRKQRKDLDNPRVVSRGAKTFKEFVEEAYLVEAKTTHRDAIGHEDYDAWRDEVASHHGQHGHIRGVSKKTFNGVEYEMRNKARSGKPKIWAASKVSDRKASAKKRSKSLKPISDDEFLRHLNRNLEPNAREVAAAASDFERQGLKNKRREAKKSTEKTGEAHDVDHMNPQPTRRNPKYRERYQAVHPGHSNANTRVLPRKKNTGKQDRSPRRGEAGFGLTRAGAIQQSIRGGRELLAKIDAALKA